MSPFLRDQLLPTARAYLDVHNDRDFSSIGALCDPECVHRAGPSTVKSPDRTNDEYVKLNEEVFKMLHTYHAKITDAVVDEVSKKVVLYLEARATADAGEYENEYVITLTMTDDGQRVAGQYDFIDSQRMIEWIGRLGEFVKKTWEKK
jgi:ketosteroid isomerase-like protein